MAYEVEKIEKEDFNSKEMTKMINMMVEKYKYMGILFEDIEFLYTLKFWYVFHVEVPVFANVSYNMGDPKVNIKTIEDR